MQLDTFCLADIVVDCDRRDREDDVARKAEIATRGKEERGDCGVRHWRQLKSKAVELRRHNILTLFSSSDAVCLGYISDLEYCNWNNNISKR